MRGIVIKFDQETGRAVLQDTSKVFFEGEANLKLVSSDPESGEYIYESEDGTKRIVRQLRTKNTKFGPTLDPNNAEVMVSVRDKNGNEIDTYYNDEGAIDESGNSVDRMVINGKEVRSGDVILKSSERKLSVVQFSSCKDAACLQKMAQLVPQGVQIHSVGTYNDQHFALEQGKALEKEKPGTVAVHYLDISGTEAASQFFFNDPLKPAEGRAFLALLQSGRVTDLSCYSAGCGFQGQNQSKIEYKDRNAFNWELYGGSAYTNGSMPSGLGRANIYYAGEDYVGWRWSQEEGRQLEKKNDGKYRFIRDDCSEGPSDCHVFYKYSKWFRKQ